jgi:hypothetical protein
MTIPLISRLRLAHPGVEFCHRPRLTAAQTHGRPDSRPPGAAAQVPFLDQALHTGPMVKVLGGADISWLVGFVVAAAGYLVASRLAHDTAPA